ncbi:hypothetical protein [Jannaschia sp. M317]|uniref:hypothetical protein n=1 Tax=Jannaschia sp. M317 TaxID=2867011 RepID=UPI0021A81534|nr:hypothetical protein [Jannaschia sp. M317]UWQ18083.1 hypothetical protein K3551_01890 [Jannaschia sp. M317]
MHAGAIIRGCLLALCLGIGSALFLIIAAASALSSKPPDWGQVAMMSLGTGAAVAVPLTGVALVAAWLAARAGATVPWWAGVALGGCIGAAGGLFLSGGPQGWLRMALIFAPMGAATGLAAWVFSFGFRRQIRFGPAV